MFKVVRPHVPPCSPGVHTHIPANDWGHLSIIDRIAARQPTSRSRRCLRWQKAWGLLGASSACMALSQGQSIAHLLFVLWGHSAEEEWWAGDSFSSKVTARKELLICDSRDLSWQLEILPVKGKESWTDRWFLTQSMSLTSPWHGHLAEPPSTFLVNGDSVN